MTFPLLNVSPSQLEFLFDADQEIKSTLTFRACQEGVRIAFKIKTTNSDRFVVCPPYGIVEPKSTRFVRVYLKAPSRYEDSLKFCQDRFLVQSIAVDDQFDERDINSDLFRSRDRQEAKLKVVVSAPLAHSTVLENEIRAIADQQGVEGHRAVLRKFSELLLARGVISQSQVALAFSAVGEIFQSMSSASRENAEDQERTFQRFLQRGVSENGRSPSTNPPVPLPRHNTFHSGWLATDYRPSNLPSRASAPTRDQNSALKTMQSSKGRSPEKSEITADESSIQNGGLRSNLSTETSSEGYLVVEDRRSTAHPQVTPLDLGSGLRPSEPVQSAKGNLSAEERPEEMVPDAYDAFAPSPDDIRRGYIEDTSEESRVENPQLEELQPDFEGKERNGENEANAEIGSQTSASSQPNEPLPTKGKREQKPGTDSLGRYFSLKIDRIGTPSVRKPATSQATRKRDPKFGEHSESSSPRNQTNTTNQNTNQGPSGKKNDRGVFIPSGNTLQKANLFNRT